MTHKQEAPYKLVIMYGKPQLPNNTIALANSYFKKLQHVCEKQIRTITGVFKCAEDWLVTFC
jgi:hypothetical protein